MRIMAKVTLGNSVAKPIAGGTHDFDMMGLQPDLLLQFTKHGLLRSLMFLDTALGKLPGILTGTTTPKQPPLTVAENNADIGSIAFGIDQNGSLGNTPLLDSSITTPPPATRNPVPGYLEARNNVTVHKYLSDSRIVPAVMQ